MTSAPFLSRRLGDYLLVAQLSEDALGPVFRALYAADERRFVRLRILRSEELAPEALESAIREQMSRGGSLSHPAIVDRSQLAVVEDIPFMTWDEASGWTLDTMLSRVRALGIRIPSEYALLIAERVAAALEHAHRTLREGHPTHHGLLWPGFVSISHDAAVRIGGFGLAQAVLPSLAMPRLTSEIAPYVAPEIRAGEPVGASADVYALGAILAELLTGRKPSLDMPELELRAGDPRSEELESFLHRCMAPPGERFASAIDAHREIQRMVTGNPFSLYTANLALFLYKLLNPESQLAAPTSHWESTNPVAVNPSATAPTLAHEPLDIAPEPASVTEPLDVTPEPISIAEPLEAISEPIAVAEALDVAAEPMAMVEAVAVAPERIRIATELLVAAERPVTFLGLDSGDTLPTSAAMGRAAAPDSQADPGTLSEHAVGPARPWATGWTRPAATLAAAAGLTVGAFLLVSQFHNSDLVAPRPRKVAGVAQAPVPGRLEPVSSAPAAPAIVVASAAPMAVVASGPTGRFETVAARPATPPKANKPISKQSRQPAEDLRLRAALARIEADRSNAKETAGDLFVEGRHNEEEGERLLHQRDYDAAQLAFSRAARLFQEAQQISWEERLRQANLSASAQ